MAVGCYLNSLTGDLVHDDIMAIRTNRDVAKLSTPFMDIFRNDFWGKPMSDNSSHKSYRPLTILTFRLNSLVSGLDPFGFHVVNVLLHALVTMVFTYVCSRVLHWGHEVTLYAGLLFATHPIHTEAVAGIVGRADVLACLLMMLCFLSYIRSINAGLQVNNPDNCSNKWLAISLVLATAAMLAKEHGITVLGIICCYDLYKLQVDLKRACQHRKLSAPIKSFLKRTFIVILVGVSLLVFRMAMLNGTLPRFSEQDNPASFSPHRMTRTLTYSYLLAHNTWLLLAPITLSYDWQMGSIPLLHTLDDPHNVATLAFFGMFIVIIKKTIVWDLERRNKAMVLGLLFLVLPFLPASNLFFTVGFVVAERILYVPSVGMSFLVGHGLSILMELFPNRRRILRCCVIFLILCFSMKTWQRNRVWFSRQTLFQSGLETLPHNAKMHYNYANLQKDFGNFQEAIVHYKTTLRLWPEHASAHNNLGTLLDDPIQAKFHFMEAIKINPLHPRAHFNIANLLSKDNHMPMAIQLMERAIHLDYTYTDAYTNLAAMYSEVGRNQDAENIHNTLLSMDLDNPDVHNNYGAFLQRIGRTEEALSCYRQAIYLQPNHTVALVNAAKLLRSMKRNLEAEELYKMALNVADDSKVRDHLGILYLNTGRVAEARKTYEELLDKFPDEMEAKVHLAQVNLQEQNIKEAEKLLREVVSANDTHRDALRQLALLYSHLNKTTEALDYIIRALKICNANDSTCAQLHAEHANILKDMNDMDTAAESYKLAVQVNPSFTLAHLNLGVIYHIKKDFKEAWKHYRTAQLLEPQNRLLLENMEKLRRAELAVLRLQTTKEHSDSCR